MSCLYIVLQLIFIQQHVMALNQTLNQPQDVGSSIKSHGKRAAPEEHPQFGDHACVYIVTDDFAEVAGNKRRMDAFRCMLEVSSITTKMNFNEGTNAMLECLAEAGEGN